MKDKNRYQEIYQIIPEDCNRESHPLRQDAFTLIELLIVVIIIGILVAIAVPQDQKAVMKSRSHAMMPLVKGLADAQHLYFMVHEDHAIFFQKLAFEVEEKSPMTLQ